jgi:polyisoprenyl-teichoic acid--peptidoglycan teichoic acid transferase
VEQKSDRSRHRNTDGFLRPAQPNRPRQRKGIQLPPKQPQVSSLSQPSADRRAAIPEQPTFPKFYSPYATEQAARPTQRPLIKLRWSKKRKLVTSALSLLLIGFALGGWYGSHLLGDLDKVFHGNVISDVTAAFNDTPLKGESSGRVNILLAGDSSDDPNHGGAQLTDSILLLSIDTKDHTAFLLSIPRDLWVNIPGLNSYQKINAANDVTNFSASGYPSGGMGQLEQIVQTQLDIPIDYYGLMDYGAFQDAVNAVGGVTITISSPDPRGLYDPYTNLRLANGAVNLNGQQALNLARARGDGPGSYGFPDSDFDRTAHQRQLFTAVAEKAKSIGVITNPVKISDLFNTLGNNFKTDLSLQNVLRLIKITKGISPSTVQSYAFSSTLSSATPNPILKNYTDPASGEAALIPSAGIGDFGQLQQYYQQLTSDNPVVKEAPTAIVLNASSVAGLAHKEETALQAKGFDVVGAYDANGQYPDSIIVDLSNNKKPASKQLLESIFTRDTTTTTSVTSSTEAGEAQGYNANFVVILGQSSESTITP